jgi:DNA-binding MarR family transcriptional regulator
MRSDLPEPDVLPLGKTFEFLRTLWAVDHALQKASKRVETTLGVTGPQRMVIRIVGRFPGISAGQLARVLHLHPSTLTGILRRVQAQGLLARWPDPRDDRRALLGLTERGKRLNVERTGTVEDRVRQLGEELAPGRLDAALGVLRRLAELLDPDAAVPKKKKKKAPKKRR